MEYANSALKYNLSFDLFLNITGAKKFVQMKRFETFIMKDLVADFDVSIRIRLNYLKEIRSLKYLGFLLIGTKKEALK